MSLHVHTSRGGWAVRSKGALRAWKRFGTRAEALAFAERNARGRTIYVHDHDARVVEKLRGGKHD
jgi:hypothetical protein